MRILVLAATALTFVAWTSAGNATMITQQVDFDFSAGPVSGTGSLPLTGASDFTASVSPFDSSVGTLNSFTVDWRIIFSASGTAAGPNNGPGFGDITMTGGGEYYLSGIRYSAAGGRGGPNGGGFGETVTFGFTVARISQFFVGDRGAAAVLGPAVLGGTDFDLLWNGGTVAKYNYLDDFTATASGRVILTYDFTPTTVPVPVPATLALFGIGLAGLGWSRRKKV